MRKKSKYIAIVTALLLVMLMYQGVPFPKAHAATYNSTAIVAPGEVHQTVEGWGTSLAWWANVVGGWPTAQQNAIADLLFSTTAGIGLNVVRYNIGGGDRPGYTNPPLRTGADVQGYEPSLGVWDWTRDATQRTMLNAAISRGANQLEAISYSPPYWMTVTNTSRGNGTADNLKSTEFDHFADYLTEVVKHFRDSWGITFQTLNPVNEPDGNWSSTGGQEGSAFSSTSQNSIINKTAASLSTKGLSTTVSANDSQNMDNAITAFNAYDSTAKSNITKINAHAYGGSKRIGVRDLAKTNGKRLWMSEYGTGGTSAYTTTDMNPGHALATEIIQDMTLMEPTAWSVWDAVEDKAQDQLQNVAWGLIIADYANQTYSVTKQYQAMGQFSKFIRPGYKIIGINAGNALAAYDQSSQTLVIVAQNGSLADNYNVTFDLTGFNSVGSYNVYRTSPTENITHVGGSTAISNKTFTATEISNSITTYVISGVTYTNTSSFDPTATYKIINRNSGKLLEVSGASTANSANVDQYADWGSGSTNEHWFIYSAGGGYYKIVNRNSGKLLEVNSALTTNGANVDQYEYVPGANNELWSIVDIGSGFYKFINRNSGKLLEVNSASLLDGANVDQYTDVSGATNEHWSIVKN